VGIIHELYFIVQLQNNTDLYDLYRLCALYGNTLIPLPVHCIRDGRVF